MPQFSDDLFLGNAITTLLPSTWAAGNPAPNGGRGFGPMGRTFYYNIVPAALAANNLATSQSPGAGAITLTAGAGVTAVVDPSGTTRYTLDVPRAVRIVSGGDDSGITYTINGYDFFGQPQTEAFAGAAIGTATGKKTWQSIISVTHTGSVAGTFTMGTTDIFGLPVYVSDAGYIASVKWNNTLAQDAGTLVVGDATSPATSSTGDVRGTYTPSANASNGSRRLVVGIHLTASQVGPNATTASLFGVTPA